MNMSILKKNNKLSTTDNLSCLNAGKMPTDPD